VFVELGVEELARACDVVLVVWPEQHDRTVEQQVVEHHRGVVGDQQGRLAHHRVEVGTRGDEAGARHRDRQLRNQRGLDRVHVDDQQITSPCEPLCELFES
jgi:hypothetical protein